MKRTKRRQTAVLALSVLGLTLIAPWVFGQDPDPLTGLLRRQAEQGDAEAQFNLGLMYTNGDGVPQDYQEAVSWYRKAAERVLGQKLPVGDVTSADVLQTLQRIWHFQLDTARRLRQRISTVMERAIALRRGAFALVFAHNHPNGVVSPTDHDKALTRAIVLAAETVSVRVLDHLIVSAHESFSFRKAGLL